MNKRIFLKLFVILTVVAALLFLIYLLLVKTDLIPIATYALEIVLVQYFVILIIFFLLLRALSSEPGFFVQTAILVVTIKLIIYAIFNFIIIYLSPQTAHANVILFLSIYLIFTTLTIGMIYPMIDLRQKERHKPH